MPSLWDVGVALRQGVGLAPSPTMEAPTYANVKIFLIIFKILLTLPFYVRILAVALMGTYSGKSMKFEL
jgi:hypothetical protein